MKLLNKDEFIANEIKYWIEEKGLREGDKLSSERELAEYFGAHRGTVRAAFDMLEEEGVLEIKSRSGRYIRHPRIMYNLAELKSFTDKANEIGAEVKNRVVAVELIQGDCEECSKFDTYLEGNVHKITRVRSVICNDEQHTIAIEYTYVPTSVIPDLSGCDLENESLYVIFTEQYGQKLIRQEQNLQIVYANRFEEEILQVSRLEPLVLKKGITYNSEGKVVECIHSVMNKDWIEFVKRSKKIEEKVRGISYEV